MRKIETIEETEKKQRRTKRILSMIMLSILVLSSLGFAIIQGGGSAVDNTATNNEEGYFNGQYWIYNVGGQDFFFTNSLESVQEVEIENINFQNLQTPSLFLDIKNQIVMNEITGNIGRYYSRIQPACYGPCAEDLPERGCDEAIIVLRESDTNKVYSENKCVFIEGDLRAADAFLYRFTGVK